MIGSSQGLNIEDHDWREMDHLATSMNPRSMEELLTKHLRGKHGDGGAYGDQSSLWQGAGTGTSADPDLGIAMAVEQWRKRGKEVIPEGFWDERNK